MKISTNFSPEVRERAVRMVREHQGEYESQWAAMGSIAAKIGCTAETPAALGTTSREGQRGNGRSSRRAPSGADQGVRAEVRSRAKPNEIPRKASAYFAQAVFDRPFKR
ncbi:MAG: hypothetical protein IPL59_13680 [Candidatus Competibacteraceae bacterium]|nr:hypothetical protein [Candidatus Competibacteraceae bacterium]